ncbi:MAG: hypothetical protein RLZZ373_1393 [Pseudomonadota bacterium]
MILVKHPRHGCRHVAPEEAPALVAAGWTRFPRSRAEKAAGAWAPVTARRIIDTALELIGQQAGAGDDGEHLDALNDTLSALHAPEIPVFIAQRAPAPEAPQARQKPRRA